MENLIKCCICLKYFKQITKKHLTIHSYSIEEYKKTYNQKKLISLCQSLKISNTLKKKWKDGSIAKNNGNFNKGHTPWNKGYGNYIRGINNPFFGKKHTNETKQKNRLAHQGKKRTKESIKKTEITRKQRYPEWHTKETIEKISKTHFGNLNPNWRNGKSFEPYTIGFTKKLKKHIRGRDDNICQLCDKQKEQNENKTLSIHHIDYNKENCSEKNLITLCASCNSKINYNRETWTLFFQTFLENKYGYNIIGGN